MARRRVAVLGCTGSVGGQALAMLREHRDRFTVCMLAAHSSSAALAAAAADFRPAYAGLTGGAPRDLPAGTAGFSDADGMLAALAASDPDVVLNAITGAAGLAATEWTVRSGRTLALANKESLVVAGEYLMPMARRSGARILPVDSEHCAIFQCLDGESPQAIRRLWLTGSGGPFRTRDLATFDAITPAEALKHPTWTMGPRITVGSATMMNKAFEVLEAHWLFDVAPSAIEVVLHPQSIVHSLVEFVDGSMLAQCGVPDMRVPILFCLGYPERLPFAFQPFDPLKWRSLAFEAFAPERYPAVGLAYEALRLGGDAGARLNAADEVATAAFLAGRIAFPAVAATAAHVLALRPPRPIAQLAEVAAADAEARAAAKRFVATLPKPAH
ncbi:MAG: 1-deoxy-D-xylulose-5-phosphate reductoisomerase [Planctomycetota bacterium]